MSVASWMSWSSPTNAAPFRISRPSATVDFTPTSATLFTSGPNAPSAIERLTPPAL